MSGGSDGRRTASVLHVDTSSAHGLWRPENVDREYLDGDLSRLVKDAAFRPGGWSHTEVKEYRRLDYCARAAKVHTDLRNLRMLRVEPHTDDPAKARARLSSGRVIGLIFKSVEGPVVFELLPPETDTT